MKKHFCLSTIATTCLLLMKLHFISTLECVYCPTHSTEDECNQMNMTQICINETKCGYARFIEKRKDLDQQVPNGYDKRLTTVTVKKGCMEEDYCTKVQQRKGVHLNFSECIFCDEDLCILKYPLLCVKCDEAVDEYCATQAEPIVTCAPEEVCFGQRIQSTHHLKRGCIEPFRCLKKNFCHHCNTDYCQTIPSPFEQSKSNKNEEKYIDNYYENASSALSEEVVLDVFFKILLISFTSLI